MQNPTHVELTILEARGLLLRGRYETNDAYVAVTCGKEKFQTSVLQRGVNPFVWVNETFLIEIPRQGNRAIINLTVYHRRLLGDECLGTVAIHLKDFQPTPNPKLMTYDLQPKVEKYGTLVTGELTVSIVFKNIYFKETFAQEPASAQIQMNDRRKSMKFVARELIEAEHNRKPKRTMSIRSIAQALLTEKRAQCTKADDAGLEPIKTLDSNRKPIRRLDSNDNEIKYPTHVQNTFSSVPHNKPPLVRVQSARGKINTHREIQKTNDGVYITQKVVSRPLSTSEESSDEDDDIVQKDIKRPVHTPRNPETHQRRNTAPASPSNNHTEEGVMPFEFRGETKMSLVEMVSQLRRIVQLQQTRIEDLENYIDGRLARVMAKNPASLEAENEF